MISSAALSYFFGFWAITYLIDAGLSHHPYTKNRYLKLRESSGVSIQILQARFFTQRLNPFFSRLGNVEWFPWNLWFCIGTAFSAVFMGLSIVILSLLAYNTIMKKPIEKQLITPVMPGVNLPMSHLSFYLLTLLVCVVLHEAGHALAALRERVRLHGFGFFLFGIYPGAYVDISDSDLTSLSPIRQLKIYSAGVWHNGVIVILSVLIFYALPWILTPAYQLNVGVGVISVQQNSVFTGHRGLHLGDAITQVNSCPVNNPLEWYKCLEEANTKTSGYCVPTHYVNMLNQPVVATAAVGPPLGGRKLSAVVPKDEANLNVVGAGSNGLVPQTQDCCPQHLSSTHLCFAYLPGSAKSGKLGKKFKNLCLPARAVTEREPCGLGSDCVRGSGDAAGGQRSMCLVPAPPDNATRLIRIVHNRARSPAILFLGPVEELMASIEISDYVPRWPGILPCRLPQIISTFCRYLFSLSGALVLLNVVPCYALDGQWILKSLIDLLLPSFICSRQIRRLLFSTLLSLGSALLSVNIGLALWYLILETTSYSSLDPSSSSHALPGSPVVRTPSEISSL